MGQASRTIVESAFRQLGIPDLDYAREMADEYRRGRDGVDVLIPGAVDTLKWFRDQGVRMALVTNGASEMQRAKVEKHDLERWFDAVLIEGEVGLGKPEAGAYHNALVQVGSEPGETWMVGDNLEWEVAAPQLLGITGIWVDHEQKGLPEDSGVVPHRIIQAISDLVIHSGRQ